MNIKVRTIKFCAAAIFTSIGFAGLTLYSGPAKTKAHNRLGSAEVVTVIASGLNNPRGLNFGPDGALYVTEAGSGGPGICGPGPEGDRCFGLSGSVTRIANTGETTRISMRLPSLATPDGSFATGVHDISFQGLGNIYLTTGFAGHPDDRAQNFGTAGANFARLARLNRSGKFTLGLDLGAYEVEENPTGD